MNSTDMDVQNLPNIRWLGTAQDMEEIEKLYGHAQKMAEITLSWYSDRKVLKKRSSKILRIFAIIMSVLGGTVPFVVALLDNSGILPAGIKWEYAGYVLFSLALGCFGSDKIFGVSSGWIRYVEAMTQIRGSLKRFQCAWLIQTAQIAAHPAADKSVALPDQHLQLLKLIQSFCLELEAIVEKESKVWMAEFQSNLKQMEQELNKTPIPSGTPTASGMKLEAKREDAQPPPPPPTNETLP